MSRRCVEIVVASLLSLLLSAPVHVRAESLATAGCPVFHCTIEATGVVTQALVGAIPVSNSNGALGTLLYQGCSGNGVLLACLYAIDGVAGTSAAGTLKVMDGTTLQPIWGSAAAPDSYDPSPAQSANGQVPVVFQDGTFAAGDDEYYVHYNASGTVLAKAPVAGSGTDFGMTPVSSTYGIVSQSDGTLTLLDLATWTTLSSLKLVDPSTNQALILASPSAGAPNVLYAVTYARRSQTGRLFSIGVNASAGTLVVNSSYEFEGVAGASPVVALPGASGLANNLVLLPTPALIGKAMGQNYLAALQDSPGTGLQLLWSIPVAEGLLFTPAVDHLSQAVLYNVPGTAVLNEASLKTGRSLAAFNIQTIGGFGAKFQLSGHIGVSAAGNVATVLLGAIETPSGQASTQFALALRPGVTPTTLLWSQALDTTTVPIGSNKSTPNVYTAAWNFVPSSETNIACVVAIAVEGDDVSTITRLCDH